MLIRENNLYFTVDKLKYDFISKYKLIYQFNLYILSNCKQLFNVCI